MDSPYWVLDEPKIYKGCHDPIELVARVIREIVVENCVHSTSVEVFCSCKEYQLNRFS